MGSTTTIYRIVFITLVIFISIVIAIRYGIYLSVRATTNKNLLRVLLQSQPNSPEKSSVLPQPQMPENNVKPRKTCEKYEVSDTRPFFDQEPPQTNLPRRMSAIERTLIQPQLRLLRLAIVACAYNVEQYVDNLRKHIEPILDLFHSSSRIFILESDSTDKTWRKLRQWSRADVETYGILADTVPKRTERIAYCRNKLLDKARNIHPDYMLVVDFDIFSVNISSFLTNFQYETQDWSVMTANLIEKYYDIWALRTLSESIVNYDVWHLSWAMQRISDYCPNSVSRNVIDIHKQPLPANRNLLEVRSAFGGAAIYKMNATKDCFYSGKPYTCEHVLFHLCMRDKNQARIFINPQFRNDNLR
ncbi:unnamed protein product [Adineta ricciae]|uniref:Uncharacterized protein n=1 Tax=Adineta ricciae TaxID=249248 RepID=A0A814ZGV9_ADIRI|nr:unnamed protein product [Adineta ricciae]